LQVTASPTIKVSTGTIIKGFDLSGVENADLSSSRCQSSSSNRNSPEVKRKEDIIQKKRKTIFSKINSPKCQSSVSGGVTPDLDFKAKSNASNEEKMDAQALYKSKRGDDKEQLHLIVVGHVDAGKSTLLGRLLCDLGQVSQKLMHKYQQESKEIGKQSFMYAWVLDETGEER